MRTVTALHEKSPSSGRYLVALDGETVGHVSARLVAELGLHIGATLDVRAEDALRDASAEQAVFDKSIELLSVRPHSERELQRKLIRKGAGKGYIPAVIMRLRELGYLNDAVYARDVAHRALVEKGTARRRVTQELFKRGVDRGAAEEAIRETLEANPVDERESALALARRRSGSMAALAPEAKRRRLYGFLARRGYGTDVIGDVVRTVLGEERDVDGA